MQSEREQNQNDLKVPLNSTNKFLHFIFRNTEINKVAYKQVIVCFAVAALLFMALSIFYFVAVGSVTTLTQLYYQPGGSCRPNTPCTVQFSIQKDMQPPVYLLYRLDDFYQNHRRYIQSKSNTQLSGHIIQQSDAKVCQPYITNADMKVTKSWGGVALDPQAVASPCGGIAYTFFNDTFQLYSSKGQNISIDQTGITWPRDKGGKYRRAQNSNSTQWVDPQNEHFISWMRTAGLPNFKKLWGKIQSPLLAGDYQMVASNSFNITEWQGNKYFILTTNSAAGGKNYLLPILFLFTSIGSVAAVVVLWLRVNYYRGIYTDSE